MCFNENTNEVHFSLQTHRIKHLKHLESSRIESINIPVVNTDSFAKFILDITRLISSWKLFYVTETVPWNAVEIRSRACQPGRRDRAKRKIASARTIIIDTSRYISKDTHAFFVREIYRIWLLSVARIFDFWPPTRPRYDVSSKLLNRIECQPLSDT